jgi:hypothetical protein
MLEVDRVSKTLDGNFTITSLLPWEGIFLQNGTFYAGLQLRVKAASKIPLAEVCVKPCLGGGGGDVMNYLQQ